MIILITAIAFLVCAGLCYMLWYLIRDQHGCMIVWTVTFLAMWSGVVICSILTLLAVSFVQSW